MASKRLTDPDALVQVTVKIPNQLRDKFSAVALLKGDIRPARRIERLIREDVEKAFPDSLENENGSVPATLTD